MRSLTAILRSSFCLNYISPVSYVTFLQIGQGNISFLSEFTYWTRTRFCAHLRQKVCTHRSLTGSEAILMHSLQMKISSIYFYLYVKSSVLMIISPLYYRLIHPLHCHLLLLGKMTQKYPIVVPGEAIVSPPCWISWWLVPIPAKVRIGIRWSLLTHLFVKVDLIPEISLPPLRARLSFTSLLGQLPKHNWLLLRCKLPLRFRSST